MRMQPIPPDAKILQLCEIAKIPEPARAAFAQDLTAAIALANRRGADYRSPDGALPILGDAEAVSAAAIALLNAIAACGEETKLNLQGLLLEGSLDDRIAAVHDLFAASDLIADALNTANGKDRNGKGRPSTEIGNPGLSAGELFAFEAFVHVKHAGGRLTLNEHGSERGRVGLGGSAKTFFEACRPLLHGINLPGSASRLKDLRAQALGK
jgi:hypothetical protein